MTAVDTLSETALPPSRIRWNEGAFAPSTRAERVAPVRFDGAAAARFKALDGRLCDPLVCLFFVLVLDLAAADARDFADRLAVARAAAGRFFGARDLGDFLRVFLDIRLPFVAFRGSIIEILRQTGQFGLRIMLKRISRRYRPPVFGFGPAGRDARIAPLGQMLHRRFLRKSNDTLQKLGLIGLEIRFEELAARRVANVKSGQLEG